MKTWFPSRFGGPENQGEALHFESGQPSPEVSPQFPESSRGGASLPRKFPAISREGDSFPGSSPEFPRKIPGSCRGRPRSHALPISRRNHAMLCHPPHTQCISIEQDTLGSKFQSLASRPPVRSNISISEHGRTAHGSSNEQIL